jgi:hypothetical protein
MSKVEFYNEKRKIVSLKMFVVVGASSCVWYIFAKVCFCFVWNLLVTAFIMNEYYVSESLKRLTMGNMTFEPSHIFKIASVWTINRDF